ETRRGKEREAHRPPRGAKDVTGMGHGLHGSATDPKTTESLLYQLLETEIGGVEGYETALQCVINDELREEWMQYLYETREHVGIAQDLLEGVGLDPEAEGRTRKLVRMSAKTLVQIMEDAMSEDDPETAQLTACACVVEAETRDHTNWQLLGEVAKHNKGEI